MTRYNQSLAIANLLCVIAVMAITVFCNNKLFLSGSLLQLKQFCEKLSVSPG